MVSCALVSGAAAEPGAADADAGNWEFDASLYLWVTDVAGEATVGDTTVDLDLDLWNDILKDLGARLSASWRRATATAGS